MPFRNNFDDDTDRKRPMAGGGEPMVKQSFKDDCDIKVVLERMKFAREAGMEPPNDGWYGDVSNMGDLREEMERASVAEEWFMRLPSAVREVAENKAYNMPDLLDDPEGRIRLQKAGMDLGIDLSPPPSKPPEGAAAEPPAPPEPPGAVSE